MFLYKNKIVITGGTGRFGSILKKVKNKYKLYFPKKTELNILGNMWSKCIAHAW